MATLKDLIITLKKISNLEIGNEDAIVYGVDVFVIWKE